MELRGIKGCNSFVCIRGHGSIEMFKLEIDMGLPISPRRRPELFLP